MRWLRLLVPRPWRDAVMRDLEEEARASGKGALWLAGATGSPILPFHAEGVDYWNTRSWDNTQVPKPFTTVALVIGEPLSVGDTTEKTIQTATASLKERLDKSEARARQMLT